MSIVVDTNVFISALIKDSAIRSLIFLLPHTFLFPKLGLTEIDKYKKRILEKSGMSESEFRALLKKLLKYVLIVKTEDVAEYRSESIEIMRHIDPDDSIFIATAIKCDAIIWSEDNHFKKQNRVKSITTKEIIHNLGNSNN